ncbi:MAG: carbohydrate kinase family protein [Verrucomicrobiae bacterium]|nr:carbohydrate kinase family protein [Verrucomicrobiae bacterium]
MNLVVIGHLLKERIVFPDKKEIGPILGSPAAYGSVAAACLGMKTGLITRIGKDMPEKLVDILRQAGVDTAGIRVGEKTTSNLLIYESQERKRLEFLQRAEDLVAGDVPESYLGAEMFLIAPINDEIDRSLVADLRRRNKAMSVELSGFGGASTSKECRMSREERLGRLKELAGQVKIIKGGEEDFKCLFGEGVDVEQKARQFLGWGAEICLVTLGSKGALVAAQGDAAREGFPGCGGELRVERVAPFHVKAIDCTGAGDVWHAGFLHEYLKTKNLKRAASFACALSSILIERTGGVVCERFPSAAQVYERMKSIE